MNRKKISIIVPVYNTKKYVGRCIDSIISQTYSDWELILVDDGSTDGSLDIMKSYEKREPRITVIRQKNSGPGIARNRGISQAVGEYIVFVDSDDMIKQDYLARLSKETADVVFIDIDQVDEEFNILQEEHMSKYQSLSKDEFLRGQMTGRILWGGVRKAVKSEFLRKNKIGFTDHKVGEEAIYSFLLMYHAESFSFIEGSVYNYINRGGSQSDTRNDDPLAGVANTLRKKLLQMGVYEQYANTVNAFIATAAIISLDRMAGMYKWGEYKSKAKARVQRYRRDVDSNQPVDIDHMSGKAKLLYPFMNECWITPIYLASCVNRAMRKH